MACVLMGLSIAALPRSLDAHEHECDHGDCPVAHGCCVAHAPAIAPSACVFLPVPVLASSQVNSPLFSTGIAASSVPFQPPRA